MISRQLFAIFEEEKNRISFVVIKPKMKIYDLKVKFKLSAFPYFFIYSLIVMVINKNTIIDCYQMRWRPDQALKKLHMEGTYIDQIGPMG